MGGSQFICSFKPKGSEEIHWTRFNCRALHKMKNQALKFIFMQAKDKRCCRSCQKEYQEDYAEDGCNIPVSGMKQQSHVNWKK